MPSRMAASSRLVTERDRCINWLPCGRAARVERSVEHDLNCRITTEDTEAQRTAERLVVFVVLFGIYGPWGKLAVRFCGKRPVFLESSLHQQRPSIPCQRNGGPLAGGRRRWGAWSFS